jgi:hypothetical protein
MTLNWFSERAATVFVGGGVQNLAKRGGISVSVLYIHPSIAVAIIIVISVIDFTLSCLSPSS